MTLGRRTILTDTVIDKICEAREIGGTFTICALHAGVSHASISEWLRTGRELAEKLETKDRDVASLTDYERQLLKFLSKLEKCEANDALNLLSVVDKAAAADPNWAWKRLQHRYPEFISVQPVDITSGGKPLEKMTNDELIKLLTGLNRTGAPEADSDGGARTIPPEGNDAPTDR